MGEVYLAHDSRLDRRVALKVLPVDLNHDPQSDYDVLSRRRKQPRP